MGFRWRVLAWAGVQTEASYEQGLEMCPRWCEYIVIKQNTSMKMLGKFLMRLF